MKFIKRFLIALIIAVPTGLCLALFIFTVVDSIEPTAPIPAGGIRVSHQSHAASHGLWYYEKHVVNLSSEQVLAFYQESGATCKENQESDFSLNAPFYACFGNASPRGGFYVQFKRQSEIATSRYTDPAQRKTLALPEQPDNSDPIGETLILVTVRWESYLD
jgi:hypothetical protein